MTETALIRVLFVEDDEDVRVGHVQALELAGFEVEAHASVEAARPTVLAGGPLVVVTDLQLPGLSGLGWLAELRERDPTLPVILITGHGDIATAVRAMREGAYDFIEKPCSSERLAAVVGRAVERRRLSLEVQQLRGEVAGWQGIQASLLGRSQAMQKLRQRVRTLATAPTDVVIYGETGAGKDRVARCLHDHSPRRRGPFVPVNCGGLPDNLVDSELFGHEAGAFTGAMRRRIGKIEHAHGGTLFLDEVESMPMAVQVKLLRALQDRCIERLGGNEPVAVDVRIVAASKADLRSWSEQGRFRADLYYRLGVAFIDLPPLRERREDIPLLFEHFCLDAARRFDLPAPQPQAEQLAALLAHPWPGNVRELKNAADRFVLGLPGDAGSVDLADDAGQLGLGEQLEHVERALITEALRRQQGDISAAARLLKLPKATLYDKLKRLRIDAGLFRDDPAAP